jgi:hypothetical protein
MTRSAKRDYGLGSFGPLSSNVRASWLTSSGPTCPHVLVLLSSSGSSLRSINLQTAYGLLTPPVFRFAQFYRLSFHDGEYYTLTSHKVHNPRPTGRHIRVNFLAKGAINEPRSLFFGMNR